MVVPWFLNRQLQKTKVKLLSQETLLLSYDMMAGVFLYLKIEKMEISAIMFSYHDKEAKNGQRTRINPSKLLLNCLLFRNSFQPFQQSYHRKHGGQTSYDKDSPGQIHRNILIEDGTDKQ